jgi:O-antigen/teichoic acid export membrane protein
MYRFVPLHRETRCRPSSRAVSVGLGLLMALSLSACAAWPWAEPPPPASPKSSRVVERDLSAGAADAAGSSTR